MQNINVNIVPDSYPQTIRYSQGDVGREFKINVVGFTIPTGATVKIQATKPSGFGFSVAGTVSGNAVSFTTTAIMTDEAGRFPAELEITKDSVVIGTANFIMWGEANPHPEGTTDGQQGTIIPELTLLVERVEAAASSVLDMEVVANTLPAGSQATYSYDEDLNKATFGIPQGEAGAGAAGVVADAYSSSKTYKVGDYVLHNSNLYRCTTAITTAEAFTAAHWTQIVLANDVSDLKTDLQLTNSFIISEEDVELPNTIKGKFNVELDEDEEVICGTHNVAQLLGIKQGTFEVNGATIKVEGTEVTITGTMTDNAYYNFATGTNDYAGIVSGTLALPNDKLYTLSQKVLSYVGSTPAINIRNKSGGNYAYAQNNTAQFTMEDTECGLLYVYLVNGTTYNYKFNICILPFADTNASPYREEPSIITEVKASGVYDLEGYAWAIGSPTLKYLKSKLPKKPLLKYSTRELPYTGADQVLDVYIPTKDGYINYIFGHTIADLTQAQGGGNVWRLIQIDAVDEALFYKFHITSLGETEMAIKIKGRDDFIGGWTHGDEWMDSETLRFVIDGQMVDITDYTDLTEFDTLQCFLVSDMYDPNDHTTKVGVHGREWLFDKNGMLLDQTVKFLADLTLSDSDMPMLCAIRGNDTVSALQITDTYIDDGNFTPYDVSEGGFTNYPYLLKSDVAKVHLLGEDSKVEATVEMLDRPSNMLGQGVFTYNGVNTYNKIYWLVCGHLVDQAVSNGDRWHVKAKFNIQVG